MKSALLLKEASGDTLCGSLISIGDGTDRRLVTIGGLVTDGITTWALAASHLSRKRHRIRSDSTVTIISGDSSRSCVAEGSGLPSLHNLDRWHRPPMELGVVTATGNDWSLIELPADSPIVRPNCVPSRARGLRHLTKHAEEPILDYTNALSREVTVLAGATGISKLRIKRETSPLRLSGDKWVTVWLAESESEYQLKRGDSGSWVVDSDSGVIYGHVVSIRRKSVYILLLKHVLREISWEFPQRKIELLLPFVPLSRSSVRGAYQNRVKALYFAQQALKPCVLSSFRSIAKQNADIADWFQSWAIKTFGMEVYDAADKELEISSHADETEQATSHLWY